MNGRLWLAVGCWLGFAQASSILQKHAYLSVAAGEANAARDSLYQTCWMGASMLALSLCCVRPSAVRSLWSWLRSSSDVELGTSSSSSSSWLLLLGGGVLDFVGTLATNVGTQSGSVGLVQLAKSTEPAFVFALCLLLGVQGTQRLRTRGFWFAAALLVCGVYFTSVRGGEPSSSGFVSGTALAWALVANAALAGRALAVKSVSDRLLACQEPAELAAHRSSLIFLVQGGVTLACSLLGLACTDAPSSLLLRPRYFLACVVAAALTMAAYRLASVYVLTRTSLVAHTLLNCTKRAVSVVLPSLWFGVQLQPINWCGVVVILAAVFFFEQS